MYVGTALISKSKIILWIAVPLPDDAYSVDYQGRVDHYEVLMRIGFGHAAHVAAVTHTNMDGAFNLLSLQHIVRSPGQGIGPNPQLSAVAPMGDRIIPKIEGLYKLLADFPAPFD